MTPEKLRMRLIRLELSQKGFEPGLFKIPRQDGQHHPFFIVFRLLLQILLRRLVLLLLRMIMQLKRGTAGTPRHNMRMTMLDGLI